MTLAVLQSFHGDSMAVARLQTGGEVYDTVYIDASLICLGAICGHQFFSTCLPPYIYNESKIVFFEMINVLVCIRVWGHLWLDKRIVIYCDNRAVVDIMERHKTRDKRLEAILRDILFVMARLNIHLEVKHVMGQKNPIADGLSRVHMEKSAESIQDLEGKGYEQKFIDARHYIVGDEKL